MPVSREGEHDTYLTVSDTERSFLCPLTSEKVELHVDGAFQYESANGTHKGLCSRNRMSHMLDTVLASMKEAPPGTFRSQSPFPFQEGTAYIRKKVAEYMASHTPESIVEPASTPAHNEYIFPEDLGDKFLLIKTEGCGYYYKPLRGAGNPRRTTWSSKQLDGQHDCSMEHLKMQATLVTQYNELDGTMILKVLPDIRLCSKMTGNVPPERLESFLAHMSELVNSDDPKVIRCLRTTQLVSRGYIGNDLARISARWATTWLRQTNLTCHDLTHQTVEHLGCAAHELLSKHLRYTPITSDAVLEGSQLVLDDLEAKFDIPPRFQRIIRQASTQAIRSIKDLRPQGTTYAQWSQSLAEAMDQLSFQMWIESLSPGPSGGYLGEDDGVEHELYWKAKAERVAEPPEDPRDLIDHRAQISPQDSYMITGYIKVYGELRVQSERPERYPRTEESGSRWIPVAGPSWSTIQSTLMARERGADIEEAGERGSETSGASQRGRRTRLRDQLTRLSCFS